MVGKVEVWAWLTNDGRGRWSRLKIGETRIAFGVSYLRTTIL